MTSDPFALIESAESIDDLDVKRAALMAAIKLLATKCNKSAEDSYALGYAWYLMPDDTKEREVETLRHLTEAVHLQPKHSYARLYLAHFYFDTSKYALALPTLTDFNTDEFTAHGQDWRDVKVAELILCCVLELRDEARIAGAVQELLVRANRVDASAIPAPAELRKVLQALVRANASKARRSKRSLDGMK